MLCTLNALQIFLEKAEIRNKKNKFDEKEMGFKFAPEHWSSVNCTFLYIKCIFAFEKGVFAGINCVYLGT